MLTDDLFDEMTLLETESEKVDQQQVISSCIKERDALKVRTKT